MEMQDLNVISLETQVIKKDGQLIVLIPLSEGGEELKECTEGLSEIEGSCLKLEIPEWLAGVLRVEEGDRVNISNLNGNFNIWAVNPRLVN